MKELICIRCGDQMEFMAKEKLQLGQTGWLMGDLPNLIAGALKVDIYICPKCKKIEFFAAEDSNDGSDYPKKTCPVCGAVHDFDYPKCPKCKHNY